jgi:hypothetical protein
MHESLKIAQRKYRLKNRENLNEKQRQRMSQEAGHGSVYMICSRNSDAVYIGSTILQVRCASCLSYCQVQLLFERNQGFLLYFIRGTETW